MPAKAGIYDFLETRRWTTLVVDAGLRRHDELYGLRVTSTAQWQQR